MTTAPDAPDASCTGASRLRPAIACVVLAGVILAVLSFYLWAVDPGRPVFRHFDARDAYYNLLVRGFRSGHLAMDVPVPPALLALKDPYDPAQNAPYRVLDASLYHGRYYLYFGVTPALILYAPFNLLTGHYLGDAQAGFILCAVGFLAGTGLLEGIRRRYYPTAGAIARCAAVLVWGIASLIPLLLRRMGVWEVAVASAFAFYLLYANCLFQAFHGRRRRVWLACASLCYGLAIASRPTYAFGALSLLVPVWAAFRAGSRMRPARWSVAAAAIVPIALVVAGLLAYNGLRFGSPFEFGQRYQLTGVYEGRIRHFSPSYVEFNLNAYFLAPAQLSPYFPFVRVPSLPPAPPGHMGSEDPYGLIPNVPFILLALAAPLALRRRPELAAFVGSLALGWAAIAVVVFSFGFASNRYMVDFVPAIVLVSVIGFWHVQTIAKGWRGLLIGLGSAAALVWSVGFGFFASISHNELLRQNQPDLYRRMVHAFGYPRHYLDRITGRTYGPLELNVRLPMRDKPVLEPLVISGSEFLSDYLYLFYPSHDFLIVGFEHTSHGGPTTKAIPIDYGELHRFRIEMAGLYPPAGDPYFDGLDPEVVRQRTETLHVWLDGLPIMDAPQAFYPPFQIRPSIGEGSPSQRALGRRFTGAILGVRTLDPSEIRPPAQEIGGLVIALEFPEGKSTGHEPLVVTGEAGKADVLLVNYLGPHQVSFTLDHWGLGGPTSGPIDIDPNIRQTLVVRFGSFFPAGRRPPGTAAERWLEASSKLELILDRHRIFEARAPFYPAGAGTLALGRNSVGASSCAPVFTGKVLGWTREEMP